MLLKFLKTCFLNDMRIIKTTYYRSVVFYENIEYYRLRSNRNYIILFLYFLEIRELMEKQKIINKSDILSDKNTKYVWSIIIKRKN